MDHAPVFRPVPGSKNAVVFIHGILGTPRHFDFLLDLVPPSWSVYNVLLAGHGGSVLDFSGASMEQWEAEIRAQMDALQREGIGVLLVGHSMGTLLAMDAALNFPETAKGLFLLNTPLSIRPRARVFANSLRAALGKIPPEDEEGQVLLNACSIRLERSLWKYIGWVPRYLELFSKARAMRKVLPELDLPCTVFHSARDELVGPAAADAARRIPRARVEILEDSSHFFYSSADKSKITHAFSGLFQGSSPS